MADDAGFLSRWSRRKAAVREGQALPEEPAPVPLQALEPRAAAAPVVPGATVATVKPEPAPLTLDDVALLTRDSNYAAFVAPQVSPEVKNAALKKLFTDPHFNVMDGLDTYIDDYSKPDPLPPGMLRQMVQSKMLGLFDDEPEEPPPEPAETRSGTQPEAASSTAAALSPLPQPDPPALPHEDADLQLQPDPAAGRARAESGPGEDDRLGPGRQH
jgi:hypothetical protein